MHRNLLLLLIFSSFIFIELNAGQWTQMTDLGGLARHRPTGVSIGNKGYIGLGHFNGTGIETYFSDWWEFDPSNNTWTQKSDFIGNNGLGDLGCQAIGLESVGFVGLGELDKLGFYKYDVATNSWSAVSSAPNGNSFQDTDEMVIGNKGYFMDLYNGNNYEYNTDTDTWTAKAPLPFSPWYSYSAFTINGFGYIKANYQLWRFDPVLNSWSYMNDFPGLAGLSSIDFVQNDKAYIVSGFIGTNNSDLTREVWEYDPTTNNWVQFPDFPGTARRYSCGFSIGDYSYLGAGTNGTNFKDFWRFDPLNTSGIEEESVLNVSIYPNPVTEYVKVQLDNKEFEVHLFDQTGRFLESVQSINGTAELDRNGRSSGHYLLNVETLKGEIISSEKILFL